MLVGGLKIRSECLNGKEVFRIIQVNKLLNNLLNTNLKKFIKSRKWSVSNDLVIALITGEINNKNDYSAYKIMKNVPGIYQIKDTRTYSELLRNIVLGWVVEDATLEKLNLIGINVDMFEDKEKKRSIRSRIQSIPDLVIRTGNKKVYLEVVQTYMDEFSTKGIIRFRFNKFKNLQKYNAKVIVYDLHAEDPLFVLFGSEDIIELKKRQNAISGKPGYLVKINYEEHSYPIEEFDDVFSNLYRPNLQITSPTTSQLTPMAKLNVYTY